MNELEKCTYPAKFVLIEEIGSTAEQDSLKERDACRNIRDGHNCEE